MRVVVGLERILSDQIGLLKGKRVGLVVNPTSVTPELFHAIDLFHAHTGIDLKAIFGPEHGARGDVQYMVDVGEEHDARTGLRVHSLYGKTKESLKPTPKMLEDVDVMVVDIQDIGSRYYTYVYTMSYCMEAAAQLGKEVVVLDRPNPLGGVTVEGNILNRPLTSFVGRYPIPTRHGMTPGELAGLFNEEFGIGCKLTVVTMRGWNREMWFDQTELPWVIPSPNMPTLDTATVYPGMCLLEGTNVSEGRGTTKPFEFLGAPWLDAYALAGALNDEKLPGVRFRPHYFVPTWDKHKNERCGGVQLHITDRDAFRSYATGIAVVKQLRRLGGKNFDWRREEYEFENKELAIDLLLGRHEIRRAIEVDRPLAEIEASWAEELDAFLKVRKKYLLY